MWSMSYLFHCGRLFAGQLPLNWMRAAASANIGAFAAGAHRFEEDACVVSAVLAVFVQGALKEKKTQRFRDGSDCCLVSEMKSVVL